MAKNIHIGFADEILSTQDTLDLLDEEANQYFTLHPTSIALMSADCTDKRRGYHTKDLPYLLLLSNPRTHLGSGLCYKGAYS